MSEQAVEAQIVAVDDERIRAVLSRDRGALERVLSDALVYVHSNGVEDDKGRYLDRVASGHYDYRAFVQRRRSFRIAGDFVFMNGENAVDIVRDGAIQHLAGRYTIAWRREGGVWRLYSFHAAPIPRQD
jgi:ketosteroid isomerase-like protein